MVITYKKSAYLGHVLATSAFCQYCNSNSRSHQRRKRADPHCRNPTSARFLIYSVCWKMLTVCTLHLRRGNVREGCALDGAEHEGYPVHSIEYTRVPRLKRIERLFSCVLLNWQHTAPFLLFENDGRPGSSPYLQMILVRINFFRDLHKVEASRFEYTVCGMHICWL